MSAPANNLGAAADTMAPVPRSLWGNAWKRIRRSKLAMACLVVTLAYVVVGLLTFLPAFDRRPDPALATQMTDKERMEQTGLIFRPVGREYEPPSFVPASWGTGATPAAGSPQEAPRGSWISRVLGTDIQGRSIFWQVVYGTRIALTIAVVASAISLTIGTLLGVIAGYFGGVVDAIIVWLVNTISSVPWILLTLAIIFVLRAVFQQAQENRSTGASAPPAESSPAEVAPASQPSTTQSDATAAVAERAVASTQAGTQPATSEAAGDEPTAAPQRPVETPRNRDMDAVILALGLTSWVGLCRLVRGEVLSIRERDYVVAARAAGLRTPRILFRHVLPNVTHLMIITFSLGAVDFVQSEVILTMLGLGISEKPSWGRMIDDAKLELLRGVWWQFAAATVAIFVLCLALNVLGDILRDALDPRLSGVE